MPVHDWSRVNAGTFHHFHTLWMPAISNALNSGVLPPDYYAMAEQIAGPFGPDVLTLQTDSDNGTNGASGTNNHSGSIALATAAPKVAYTAETEMDEYVLKQRTLVIRHSSDDRIIALVEIVSPGNKASRHALRSFVEKATAALYRGYHLLILDLQPPGPRDPQGIHGVIWAEISDSRYTAPANKALTLAAYSAGHIKRAFVQPLTVGDVLPDMPLFLEPEVYVNVPLEAAYRDAYRGVPARWRRVLEKQSPE
ncbi:MAG TPA: DUF4058 family protein [Gemmataceae bacterium]|nr:DUF4058 family protein [Gemmataceae bacterium]